MYHFFVELEQVTLEEIVITGSDVNHIKNVLRLTENEEIKVSDKTGSEYKCVLTSLTKEEIRCKIQSVGKSKAELPVKITLFQGVPKQDKMELIIQKTVELGVYDITPVTMGRSIVKYDHKKLIKKNERWQSIATSAAKQSKRGIIPKVNQLLTFNQLLIKLDSYDKVIIPYENENGMNATRKLFESIKEEETIAIIVGPEGGFTEDEIDRLREIGGYTITLGNRILRTETAGFASLAMISYQIEEI